MQTDSARKLGLRGPWEVDVGRGGQGMVRVVSRVSGDIVLWEVMLKVRRHLS